MTKINDKTNDLKVCEAQSVPRLSLSSMGNQSSQPSHNNEEVEPILSNAASTVQSDDSDYTSTSESDMIPSLSNGTSSARSVIKSTTRSYVLKTEQQTDATVVRVPYHYNTIHSEQRHLLDSDEFEQESRRHAFSRRVRYLHRLDPGPRSSLAMPDHVVPPDFMISILPPVRGKQSSFITIFALWNTMMGTSLLSMPWAILQAGFVAGIVCLVFMCFIMFYTSYLILKSIHYAPEKQFLDFSDVCAHFLGKHSKKLVVFASLATLLGGAIVYWILLSNFLYHIVLFIKNEVDHDFSKNHTANSSLDLYPDAQCTIGDNSSDTSASSAFEKFWTLDLTVPLLLAVPLFALVNFKSAVIFTKINTFGVFSVVFLYIFTIVKAAGWGVHLDLGTTLHPAVPDPSYASAFEWTFPALTGISALAYFIHNAVITIVRNQKSPENNIRDLAIAYILVCVSYVFIGVLVFMTFPLAKSCLKDNFLNNIAPDDVMAFVAHIMLFMQMTCVFPLLTYILRAQVLMELFKTEWPSWKHVVVLNACVFGICILFAIFLPHIGRIIGFVGAFCGLVYAMALPCLVHMKAKYLNKQLSWPSLILHTTIIVIGLANFISQFILIGKIS